MADRGFWVELIDEDTARGVAKVAGEHSAFGRALKELDERRAKGERLVLMRTKGWVLIVPENHVLALPSGFVTPRMGLNGKQAGCHYDT